MCNLTKPGFILTIFLTAMVVTPAALAQEKITADDPSRATSIELDMVQEAAEPGTPSRKAGPPPAPTQTPTVEVVPAQESNPPPAPAGKPAAASTPVPTVPAQEQKSIAADDPSRATSIELDMVQEAAEPGTPPQKASPPPASAKKPKVKAVPAQESNPPPASAKEPAAAVTAAPAAPSQEPPSVKKSVTLHECIEHALAGNLEIRVERLNADIQDWGVVRERGGFEPALKLTSNYENLKEPLDPERASAVGRTAINTERLRLQSAVVGKLPIGTEYEVFGQDVRTFGTLAPDAIHLGSTGIRLTQPLLRDGWTATMAGLRIARINRLGAKDRCRSQIIESIGQVTEAYYDLVYALQDHKAKLEDLERAKRLVVENRQRVEAGVLTQLDMIQAESGAAQREETVIVAERDAMDRENALKRLLFAQAAELRAVSLEPDPLPPFEAVDLDVEKSIHAALQERTDYHEARHNLEKQHVLRNFRHNQLLPRVDLQAGSSFNGRASSIGTAWDAVGSTDFPQWSAGLVVTIPLGNQQAEADYRVAELEEQQAELKLSRLEQDIIIQVDNAIGRIRTNLKRMAATRSAVHLAEESLKAEEQRLQAGKSTSFLVLQAQAELAKARSADIQARADYNKSLIALAKAEGSTLKRYNITLEDDL